MRDASGAKMSKSKGNVIDPLGSHRPIRRRRAALHARGDGGAGARHQAFHERVEGYRNFATKLWNAARFAEINGCAHNADFSRAPCQGNAQPLDRPRDRQGGEGRHGGDRAYKFNDAAAAIYRFVWNVYCDWYLELIKPVLLGPDSAAKTETRAIAAWALDEILKLLHPFMPFITEELWRVTAEQGPKRHHMLALDAWPDA